MQAERSVNRSLGLPDTPRRYKMVDVKAVLSAAYGSEIWILRGANLMAPSWTLEEADPELSELLHQEAKRQHDVLELIPSENYTSLTVLETLGSVLTNKYSEGYPNRRYYGGNEFIDHVERLAQTRAKRLFKVAHVNVQPYSGSPANLAVYLATCQPGDPIMGQHLTDGGHLTHGWRVSVTGQWYRSIPYHVDSEGWIDLEEVERLATDHRPRLIWVGATAYPRQLPFEAFAKIADRVDAYLVADIAHVAGLVVGGVHPDPVPHAHIITTTTHKTLRGPRGALIMVTERGLDKDPKLPHKLERAVFPGLQGGPHNHVIAAIAVALNEADGPAFRRYARQVVANANALVQELIELGFRLVTGGTDNHMMLVDLSPIKPGFGSLAQEALELAGIVVNKNTIPKEPSSPFYPSGMRLGTPAVSTRGMGEEEMRKIAHWIDAVLNEASAYQLPDDNRPAFLKRFREEMAENQVIVEIKQAVRELCAAFPPPTPAPR